MTNEELERAVERVSRMADWLSSLTDAPAPSSSPQAAKDLRAILSERAELLAAVERMRGALFMCAAHCQGGHSGAGYAAAQILGVPFPVTMSDLAAKARAEGLAPDQLWPWYGEMRVARAALTTGEEK